MCLDLDPIYWQLVGPTLKDLKVDALWFETSQNVVLCALRAPVLFSGAKKLTVLGHVIAGMLLE